MVENGFLVFFVGVFSGFLGGFLGIGGGVFLVPVLSLYLNVPFHQAVAISILAIVAASSAVSIQKIQKHEIHFALASLLEVTTLVFGVLGALFSFYINESLLKKVFAVTLLLMIPIMILRKKSLTANRVKISPFNLDHLTTKQNYFLTSVASFAGFFSGLLGLGGGVFMVPTLVRFAGLPMRVATATSSYMMGITALGSGVIYLLKGNLNITVTALTIMGVLPGARIGGMFSSSIAPKVQQFIFSLLLIIIGVKVWIES